MLAELSIREETLPTGRGAISEELQVEGRLLLWDFSASVELYLPSPIRREADEWSVAKMMLAKVFECVVEVLEIE